MRLIVGDTETTGGEPPQGVVEIAWIEIDEDLNKVDEVCSLIDPERTITASAIGIHGIYPEHVTEAPTIAEFFNVVHPDSFGNEPVVLIAHKAAFDEPFFRPFIPNFSMSVCTLRLARRFLPEAEDYKLATLKAQFRLFGGSAHSALGDCDTCLSLLRMIQKREDRPIMELHKEAQKPVLILKMPFGKHKDTLISEVDKGYVRWALTNLKEMDMDLKFSLEQRLNG